MTATVQPKHDYSLDIASGYKLTDQLFFTGLVANLPIGSDGRAFHIQCRISEDGIPRDAVLKVLSHDPNPKFSTDLERDFKRELSILASLTLSGVPRLLGYGTVPIKTLAGPAASHAPFICTDFAKGMMLADLLKSENYRTYLNPLFLLDALGQCLDLLASIHRMGIVHLDLNPGNILISPEYRGFFWRSNHINIIDFGRAYAAHVPREPPSAGETYEAMTQMQKDVLLGNSRRYPQAFVRSDNAKLADLNYISYYFAFALGLIQDKQKRTPAYQAVSRAVGHLSATGGSMAGSDRRVSAAQSELRTVVNTETLFLPVNIRTFTSQSAVVPREILSIVDTPSIQRLRNVYQLGLTQHVYPGATHTRFVHSLGVLDITNRYVLALRKNSPDFARQYSETKHVQLLAYALMHDIGHYPFAHYLEEIPKSELQPEIIPYIHHENLGKSLYDSNQNNCDLRLLNALHSLQIDPEKDFDALLKLDGRKSIWRQIIDGPLDADKLDYLIRDGIACGVPYAAAIDTERLINSLTVLRDADDIESLGISG